jgi:hypothetical protein
MDTQYTFMMMWLPCEWVPFEVIELLNGIKRDDAQLWGAFQAWSLRLRRPREVLRPNEVNRHAFESYLQQSRLLPEKTAAVRVGMSLDSFQDVLDTLDKKGNIVVNTRDFLQQVVTESLIREFPSLFPALQNRIFGDHDDFCSRLHAAIKDDLGIEVKPVRCETSEALGQDPADFAYDHDCFTGRPIGLRYQVWLDFKKPMNLRPDACSMKLYVEKEAQLKPLVFAGREPDVPDGLRQG